MALKLRLEHLHLKIKSEKQVHVSGDEGRNPFSQKLGNFRKWLKNSFRSTAKYLSYLRSSITYLPFKLEEKYQWGWSPLHLPRRQMSQSHPASLISPTHLQVGKNWGGWERERQLFHEGKSRCQNYILLLFFKRWSCTVHFPLDPSNCKPY